MGLFDFLRPKPRTVPAESMQRMFEYERVNRFFDQMHSIVDPVVYFGKIPERKKLIELYYDDEIASAIDTRMEAAVCTPWTLEGGSDDVNAFIYDNLTWNIKEILNYSWWAVAYGYSVIQIVYEMEGNRIGWGKVYDQPFDYFGITRENVLYSATDATKKTLEPYKFFHTVSKQTYRNPLGESLLAKVYYPYYFKCNGWDFYLKYLERWGSPMLHAKTDLTSDEVKKILQKLGESKRPTAIVTPKDVDIAAVEGVGAGGAAFDQFQKSVTERIQKVILGQTLTSGTGDTGSLALGEVHNQVRLEKKKSDCDLLQGTVQSCIDALFYLNGFTGDIPTFVFADPRGVQKELADRDAVLHGMGVRFNDKYYIENYDIDPEHFKVSETASRFGFKDETFNIFKDMGLKKHSCKFAHLDDPQVKAQISLENEMIALSQNAFSKEELRSAIKSAKNEKDLQEKLAILMEKDSGKFEEVLTKALYMAKLEGFVNGKDTV